MKKEIARLQRTLNQNFGNEKLVVEIVYDSIAGFQARKKLVKDGVETVQREKMGRE